MSTQTVHKKNSTWIWYFIGIALIAGLLLMVLVFFIQNQIQPAQQLKLEQLQAARKLWVTKGIKDYQLLYTVLRDGGQSKDLFFVEVRGGKVQSVVLNGKDSLPADLLPYRSMEALFNDIEIFLKQDARPDSPRVFCRGYFDGDDGHLLLFIRRVVGGSERVEIKVEEFKPLPLK